MHLICHTQGSRVIQNCLRYLPSSSRGRLIKGLTGSVASCAKHTHASWGICIAFEVTRAPFILSEVCDFASELGKDQHGCRVFQSVLQHAKEFDMDISVGIDMIARSGLLENACHPFCNYAIQVILRLASEKRRGSLIEELLPHLLRLATSRYGSNVAELVISLTSPTKLHPIAETIFDESNKERLVLLAEHPYGNYVLQSLLRRLDKWEARPRAIDKLRTVAVHSNFGAAILDRLEIDQAAVAHAA